jgi:hypothetical protein
MKFCLRPTQAEQVQAWAGQHLALDPYADASLENAYTIRSIYFDTRHLDAYHRTPCYRRRKFRVRRYGSECGVFLERKYKVGDRVSKRRTFIAGEELALIHGKDEAGSQDGASDAAPLPSHALHLGHLSYARALWAGDWFRRGLSIRQLGPRCLISYQRVAYVGMGAEGPLRVTLDRDIQCTPTQTCDFHVAGSATPLLTDVVILELKFRAALPALFKRLLADMGLCPNGVSKYRAAIDAWGLAGRAREAGRWATG